MSKKAPGRRFDLVEVALIVGVASALVGTLTALILGAFSPLGPMVDISQRITVLELEPIAEQYGPERVSQYAEEWIVRDAFKDRRAGVFVDVGANHYRRHSVTYYLDTTLEWTGVAVDAQAEYAAEYAAHRPRTRFVVAFVSDRDDETATLHIPKWRPLNASGNVPPSESHETRAVPTATLNRILDEAGIGAIDFLNLDIEGFENQALAGFDIERFRPSLACVEAHPAGRQQILDYFHSHGYVVVGKYLRMDPLNLYFTPTAKAPVS